MSDEAELLASKFRRLVEERTKRDTTKIAADKAEEDYRKYEAELFDEIQEGPLKGTIKLDLGDLGTIAFTPRETVYGRVIDADQAAEYFEKRGEGREMVNQKIAKGKLNERVKELVEQGKPMPPGIDFYVNRGLSISKKG